MKKSGLLHPELSALVAAAGHGQRIVIADTGTPIPTGVLRIELGVVAGVPDLLSVLRAVLSELVIEGAEVARETREVSPHWYAKLLKELPTMPNETTHAAIKASLPEALAVIRTGEATPYANVVLICGVSF